MGEIRFDGRACAHVLGIGQGLSRGPPPEGGWTRRRSPRTVGSSSTCLTEPTHAGRTPSPAPHPLLGPDALALACGDKDDDSPDSSVPDEVLAFLDTSHLDDMEAAGLPIYRGSAPPSVAGQYLADSLVVIYDDLDMSPGIYPYTYTFSDQSGAELQFAATNGSDNSAGAGAFISGEGECFSVYIDEVGETGGCTYATPSIYSGCVAGSGDLDGWTYGLIMVEQSGTCSGVIPVGHRRIFEESDGVAERQ